MRMQDLIDERGVKIGLSGTDKWAVIDELIDHLVEIGRLDGDHKADVRRAVVDREKSLSTGIEHGVALPHGSVPGLSGVLGVLGIAHGEAVPWESLDDHPSDLIVLLVIPAQQAKGSIRTLAGIARLLRHDHLRERLRQAPDAAAVMQALREEEATDALPRA